MKTRLISYNVNGIRAAVSKGFLPWLAAANPDVLCLQETKAHPEQLDLTPFENLGYHHYWFSAVRKGYSGVAILSKETPNRVAYGCGISDYDDEGRIIRCDFNNFSIISVYMPSGSGGDVRQAFKLRFLDDFHAYINELKKEVPRLIISGDYNICHHPVDIHNPVRNAHTPGFTPEERAWMTAFLEGGFTDSFRHFNQDHGNYTWWSYRANARAKNLGWRIDYHMVSNSLQNNLYSAGILKEARHSDHCPVLLTMEF